MQAQIFDRETAAEIERLEKTVAYWQEQCACWRDRAHESMQQVALQLSIADQLRELSAMQAREIRSLRENGRSNVAKLTSAFFSDRTSPEKVRTS